MGWRGKRGVAEGVLINAPLSPCRPFLLEDFEVLGLVMDGL
jgi:hypothetical protein